MSTMAIRRYAVAVGLGFSGMMMACSALDVTNPTITTIETVQNPFGATSALNGSRFDWAVAQARAAVHTGWLTDEFFIDEFPGSRDSDPLIDLRESEAYETSITGQYVATLSVYTSWQKTYRDATVAQAIVRAYATPKLRGPQLAQVFIIRGFAMLGLAEHICPGFPIREVDVSDLKAVTPLYTSPPQTTESAFTHALADFDSALVYGVDSARVLQLAQVGKARALLGLGRMTEAKTVANTVPTEYLATEKAQEYTFYFAFRNYFRGTSVSNREGGTGLDFVSASDPRMPELVVTHNAFNGDTTASLYIPAWGNDFTLPTMTMASGIEARLIEAEAELATGGPWLSTINSLRARVALPDTTDPGTPEARVNLLFRERAFWLFGTAHRLGDLRRLAQQYGRSPNTVFPSGTNRVGDAYAGATSLPFMGKSEHIYNPAITGCTSR